MKKAIIIVAIILTSGLAAFAFAASKPVDKNTVSAQNETTKVKVEDPDMRANLSSAD